jgi:predicted Fe-Mo cluster-binding NifX family protein
VQIVITAQEPSRKSPIDPRFGRAKHFILADTQSGAFTSHDNAQNLNAPQGAGIQAAQAVARLGAEAVLTGHVGPKAFAVLKAANIVVYTGASGTVREAIDGFKSGKLQAAQTADVEGHWNY